MKNGKYLDSLSSDKKSRILKNIASHYGISVADAEDEVRDEDAEMLYEYIANDKSLRMEVYNDMERGKMAKGGMTEHGLEVGDYITNDIRVPPNKEGVEVINIPNREQGNVWLSKGQRDVEEFAKGGVLDGDLYKIHYLKVYENGEEGDSVYVKEIFGKTENQAIAKFKKMHPKYKIEWTSKYEKGGKTKKDPPIVRSYFEDEAIDYAKGGSVDVNSLNVGDKIGFLRPRTGRYEYADILSIEGDNINLVVRHPKRSQWDNYFTETKERVKKFTNQESEDFKEKSVMKIKKFADGGTTAGWCYSIGGL